MGLRELKKELDKQKVTWCRNSSRSGYPIPLLSPGQSKNFYPAWTAAEVDR